MRTEVLERARTEELDQAKTAELQLSIVAERVARSRIVWDNNNEEWSHKAQATQRKREPDNRNKSETISERAEELENQYRRAKNWMVLLCMGTKV